MFVYLSSLSKPAKKHSRPSHPNERAIPPSSRRELSDRLHKYILRDRLGKGSYGDVYLAETRIKGIQTYVAIKVIRRSKLVKESTRALLLTEVQNMKHLTSRASPFFTLLHETFLDAHNYYIVTDYLRGGTLRDEMNLRRSMTDDRVLLITAQVVAALGHLRSARIIHRDLKPENVLLDALGNITIADLGLSRRFIQGQKPVQQVTIETAKQQIVADAKLKYMTSSTCGTLAYVSPEMFRGEPYSFKIDIYALGVILYELLFDALPYPQKTMKEIARAACRGAWKIPNNVEIHPCVFDLLLMLLCPFPEHRIDLLYLRVHPFFERIDWPTLEARAYELPLRHAPTLTARNRAGAINLCDLLDPAASVPDDWDPSRPYIADIDDKFTIDPLTHQTASALTRPKNPRTRSYRTRRTVHTIASAGGILKRLIHVADRVSGLKGRIIQHRWSSIGCEQFIIYKENFDTNERVTSATGSVRNSPESVREHEQPAVMPTIENPAGKDDARQADVDPAQNVADTQDKLRTSEEFSLFNCSIVAVPVHADSMIFRGAIRTSIEEHNQLVPVAVLSDSVDAEGSLAMNFLRDHPTTASIPEAQMPMRPGLLHMRQSKSDYMPKRPRPTLRRIATDLPVASESLTSLDSHASFNLDQVFNELPPAHSLELIEAEKIGVGLDKASRLPITVLSNLSNPDISIEPTPSYLSDSSSSRIVRTSFRLSAGAPPSLATSSSASVTNSMVPSSGPITPSSSRASDVGRVLWLKNSLDQMRSSKLGVIEDDFAACATERV